MNAFAGKRLVVFGCGYVGTAVALAAAARGAVVTALTRNAASAVVLREQSIEVVVADLATDAWHGQIPGTPEFALNCVSSGGGGLDGYRHSYVEGMRSIVAWTDRHGPVGTLLYTSSTSVYPQGGGVAVDETAPTVAGTAERAGLLVQAEERLRQARDACARWFILRLAGIYGPGRHHLVEQVRTGAVAGNGDTRLNLVHRDDIEAAVLACFGAPADEPGGVFNVVDDRPSPKSEVVRWLAAQLGMPEPVFTGAVAGGRRAVTPDRVILNRQLKERLAWRPRYPSYREGYRQMGLAAAAS